MPDPFDPFDYFITYDLGCDHGGPRVLVAPSPYAWCQRCYDEQSDLIGCAYCGRRFSLTLDVYFDPRCAFITPLCPNHRKEYRHVPAID